MKKAILLLLLCSAAIVGFKVYEELQKPAEGVVMLEAETTEEVVTEEESADPVEVVTEEVEEVIEEVEEVVEEVKEEVFKPLAFTGKRLNAFAKKHGGRVLVIGGIKAVKVGDDYYYKKDGVLYVRHNGIEIKL